MAKVKFEFDNHFRGAMETLHKAFGVPKDIFEGKLRKKPSNPEFLVPLQKLVDIWDAVEASQNHTAHMVVNDYFVTMTAVKMNDAHTLPNPDRKTIITLPSQPNSKRKRKK